MYIIIYIHVCTSEHDNWSQPKLDCICIGMIIFLVESHGSGQTEHIQLSLKASNVIKTFSNRNIQHTHEKWGWVKSFQNICHGHENVFIYNRCQNIDPSYLCIYYLSISIISMLSKYMMMFNPKSFQCHGVFADVQHDFPHPVNPSWDFADLWAPLRVQT